MVVSRDSQPLPQMSADMSGISSLEAPVGVEGKWVWPEDAPKLVFIPTGGSACRRKVAPKLSFSGLGVSQSADGERRVTLDDVKAVAVQLIATPLLQKMHKSTAALFDECCNIEQMNAFLWATLLYFDAFLEHKRAASNENVSMTGALGKDARVTLKKSQKKVEQAKVNFGEAYSVLVLGLGHRKSHHTHRGRLKVSKTITDQHLYEAVYQFAMYVTWITFGYEHWKDIHEELGRMLRTPQFNRDFTEGHKIVHAEGLGAVKTNSDLYLSYRVHYDRPPVGSLKELRSPALVNYFPSAKDRYSWAFEPPYRPIKAEQERLLPSAQEPPERFGIIGELMSKVDAESLKVKKQFGKSRTSVVNTSSEESDSDDIPEDEGSSDLDSTT